MPKDNLLNSACLELFEFIKRENVKAIIIHLVETYRDQLKDINYVPTFQQLILRHDQLQGIQGVDSTDTSFITQDGDPSSSVNANPLVRHNHAGVLVNGGGTRWQGIKDTDADEEAYFDSVDNEDDEDELTLPTAAPGMTKPITNGLSMHSSASSVKHQLVSYPDDDNEDGEADLDSMDVLTASPGAPNNNQQSDMNTVSTSEVPSSSPESPATPISIPAKRRRGEEDEEDELSKLAGSNKRRTSSASLARLVQGDSTDSKSGNGEKPLKNGVLAKGHEQDDAVMDDQPNGAVQEPDSAVGVPQHGHMLRRKGSIKSGKDGGTHGGVKKIAINFSGKRKDESPSTEEE